MAAMGWCPSGRLFEAAACGVPIVSDDWDGLDRFFAPGEEILLATDAGDVLAALALSDAELRRIADAARERRPGLPVLFITGYAGAALEEGLAHGMAVITKPFALTTLAARVNDMLLGPFDLRRR